MFNLLVHDKDFHIIWWLYDWLRCVGHLLWINCLCWFGIWVTAKVLLLFSTEWLCEPNDWNWQMLHVTQSACFIFQWRCSTNVGTRRYCTVQACLEGSEGTLLAKAQRLHQDISITHKQEEYERVYQDKTLIHVLWSEPQMWCCGLGSLIFIEVWTAAAKWTRRLGGWRQTQMFSVRSENKRIGLPVICAVLG